MIIKINDSYSDFDKCKKVIPNFTSHHFVTFNIIENKLLLKNTWKPSWNQNEGTFPWQHWNFKCEISPNYSGPMFTPHNMRKPANFQGT
jgi:hypothetical protein